MNRRLFLNHAFAGALGSLCLTRTNLMASIAKKRKLSKIGLQLYTVRRELEKDFEGTLAQVAALGFSEVEFAGYLNRTPQQVKSVLAKNNLAAPSVHALAGVLRSNLQQTIDAAKTIGHQYVVCAYLLPEERKSLDDYKRLIELFNDAGGRLKKAGLQFCYHNHDYKWFSVSRGSDQSGPYQGIPYDGADPKYADLYLDSKVIYKDLPWNEEGIPESWKRQWFLRIKDLVDNYQPDFLYSDGALPFQKWGLSLVAHLYNQNARRHGGKVEAVYTSKRREDCETGTCVLDLERGLPQAIWPNPWQTDTCIGDWHYNKAARYKSPKRVIDMLVDIVSRNGNLLLNFPLPNSGMLDSEEMKILDEITRWMAINGEAIYATRPWKIFGEGPGTESSATQGGFNGSKRKDLTAKDVRFTTNGQTLYAFVMGWPEEQAVIAPLATNGKHGVVRIGNVELLGYPGKVQWSQDESGLKVQLPAERPGDHAFAFKITGP